MANSDKNIVITPNIGSSSDDPKIVFSGANSSTSAQNISLKVYPTNSGTVSWEGSAGQLFSITNSMSGTIFSVNDVSGVPSIEVLDTGLVKMNQYNGDTNIGGTVGTSGNRLTLRGYSASWDSSTPGATTKGTLHFDTYGATGSTDGSAITFSAKDAANPVQAGIYVTTSGSFGTRMSLATTDSYTTGPRVALNINESGVITTTRSYLQATGSLRAPIFYDSDNTGYYVDPNGSANIASSVYAGAWFRTYGNQGLYSESYGNHFYPTGNDYWNIAGNNGSVVGLVLRTGGHQGSVRGYLYAESNNSMGLLNQDGSWRLRISGGDYAAFDGSSARAKLYYDTDNTSYYLDAGSTSVLNTILQAGNYSRNSAGAGWLSGNYGNGGETGVTTGAIYSIGGSYYPTSSSLNNMYGIGYTTGSAISAYSSGWGMYVANTGSIGHWFDSENGIGYSKSSKRSPIFYDSSDTGYYCDPNSTSNLYALTLGGRGTTRVMYYQGFSLDANTMDGNATGFTYSANAPYTGPIVKVDANGYDLWFNSPYIGGNGLAFRTRNGDTAGLNAWRNISLVTISDSAPSSPGVTNFWWQSSTGKLKIYYYDGNTSQWVDAVPIPDTSTFYSKAGGGISGPVVINSSLTTTGTSVLNAVNYSGVQFWSSDSVYARGTNTYGYRFNNYADTINAFLINNSGDTTSYASSRAPIFYDSNDTGYYVNPNSTSYFYGLTLSGSTYFRPNNWIQLDAEYGLYWPNTNGAHLHANNLSSYGSIAIRGTRSGWRGIHFYDGGNTPHLMFDGSSNGGIYYEGGGRWANYYNYSNDCTGFGTANTNASYNIYCPKGVYSGGRVDGTIFYDANDTTYYWDPTATSSVTTTVIGAMYFRANRNTDSSSPPLQAYSNDNGGAIMAFHRSGQYAINFGLDSDNVIRFGGWSASANRLQMDMSGNLTMAGNVTAYSDIRLKENIEVITDALNKVKQIRGVTFTRNDQEDKTIRYAGVIAQEVEEVLPEVVSEDNSGVKNVAYGNMVGLLIEAIKEQQKQIEDLRAEVMALKG